MNISINQHNNKKSVNITITDYHGGDGEDRTLDLLNAIQALSQLSYAPISEVIGDSEKVCILSNFYCI